MTAASTARPARRGKAELSSTTRVLVRWRGMGAILAVAFYSLFFAAHEKFQATPAYVNDGVFFGGRTQTVFNDLIIDSAGDHKKIGPGHPAFTLLHQPPVQVLIKVLEAAGFDTGRARKHAVGMLTCLAGALSVVMVYHALLWAGAASLRAILLAVIYGASTCAWIVAPLPEVWTFAGLGVTCLVAAAARGHLAPWWLNLLAAVYALACFAGNIVPVVLLALVRCAQDKSRAGRFDPRTPLIVLAAVGITFGLATAQRHLFPLSSPLPRTLAEVQLGLPAWQATAETPGLVAREVFLSNIVAPKAVTTEAGDSSQARPKVVLETVQWSGLDLQKGLGAGWLLLLALAFAGLVWGAQVEPLTLGIAAILVWNIAGLPWYGSADQLLMLACLWTPVVIIATGLGLERSLARWPALSVPLVFLLVAFVAAQMTRNWAFLQEVTAAAQG